MNVYRTMIKIKAKHETIKLMCLIHIHIYSVFDLMSSIMLIVFIQYKIILVYFLNPFQKCNMAFYNLSILVRVYIM